MKAIISILALGYLLYVMITCNPGASDYIQPESDAGKSSNPEVENVAVEIFNDVEQVRANISAIQIGVMSAWWGDDLGWRSVTNYYEYGSENAAGMRNNFAYYLKSDDKRYVRSVKLVLNMNNPQDSKNAMKAFAELAKLTFNNTHLVMPDGLLEAIQAKQEFEEESDTFITKLVLDKSNIDSWELVIESK